jgi:hypothetical protein
MYSHLIFFYSLSFNYYIDLEESFDKILLQILINQIKHFIYFIVI